MICFSTRFIEGIIIYECGEFAELLIDIVCDMKEEKAPDVKRVLTNEIYPIHICSSLCNLT